MNREVLFTAITILVAIFLAIGAMDLVDVMMDAEFTKEVGERKRDVTPAMILPQAPLSLTADRNAETASPATNRR